MSARFRHLLMAWALLIGLLALEFGASFLPRSGGRSGPSCCFRPC